MTVPDKFSCHPSPVRPSVSPSPLQAYAPPVPDIDAAGDTVDAGAWDVNGKVIDESIARPFKAIPSPIRRLRLIRRRLHLIQLAPLRRVPPIRWLHPRPAGVPLGTAASIEAAAVRSTTHECAELGWLRAMFYFRVRQWSSLIVDTRCK